MVIDLETRSRRPRAPEGEKTPGRESGKDNRVRRSKSELDRMLDQAIEDSFPASDPVSVMTLL
ncbi:MAG TPA: hypothetical protein VFP60_00440 [Pseudolabrys sp.]|nr:hypothetical protein [Pseudolabrys sp.]